MGNQRISDLTPIQSGSLDKNLNVIPVVSGNETYQLALTDLQSDIDAQTLKTSGSVDFSYPTFLPGAWSTGGALSTPRYRTPGGAGDKNSALAFGGYTYSSYVITGDTEAYDGSSWSAANPMITPRNNLAGFGSQDAAVAVGGNSCRQPWRFAVPNVMSCTEEYNGATWTVGGALSSTPYGRNGLSAVGTQNAGLAFGGYPEYVTSQTEKYDGSAWSAAAALNSTRYNSAGAGTQNAALMFGGASANTPDYYTTCTEAYNGTTWSTQAGLSIGRYYLGGSGTQNATLAFGGYSSNCGYESCTEKWDGNAWSTDTPLSNGRYSLGSTGNSTGNSLAFGGVNWDGAGTYCMNCTEEYTDGSLTHITRFTFNNEGNTSLTGSFQGSVDASSINLSSGDLNIPENMISRGATIEGTMNVYDSSSLYCNLDIKGYEFNNISIGGYQIINRQRQAGTGTLNAALSINGQTSNSNSSQCNCTEEYDGTSWAVGGATIKKASTLAAAGYQNSAIKFGGWSTEPSPSTLNLPFTEEYDGTTWTSGGNLNQARCALGGSGTQNATLAMGGRITCVTNFTEEYNGNVWSISSNMNIGKLGGLACLATAGTQNATIIPGAYIIPSVTPITEEYNGISWSTLPSISDQLSFESSAGGSVNDTILMGCIPNVPASSARISKFNGVSWTVGPNLLAGAQRAGSTTSPGTGTTGAVFGGCISPLTQEYTNFGIIVPKFGVDTDGSITSPSGSISIGGCINTGDNIISPTCTSFRSINTTLGNSIASSWSAASALPRNISCHAGAGTQNSTLSFGGTGGFPGPVSSCTDEYNGTSWSSGGALITGRGFLGGAGTQNAALAIGGTSSQENCTEEYDGSTWSSGGALIIASSQSGTTGIQSSALVFGGSGSPVTCNNTQEYNGTSWSIGGNLINRRNAISSAGFVNSALAMGGNHSPSPSINGTCTEEYNGISWSESQSIPESKTKSTGGGIQNDAFVVGGRNLNNGNSYYYNGLSYTTGNSLITRRDSLASGGDTGAAIVFGGDVLAAPFAVSCTEEVTNFYVSIPRVTSTTREGNTLSGISKLTTLNPSQRSWSAGGNMIQGVRFMSGVGTQDAALATGRVCATEEYNGSTWSAGGNLINARCASAAAGVQNAALLFGGNPTSFFSCTEEYNGSSWSAGGALITGRNGLGGAGSQNAGLAFGGVNPAVVSCTEEYDGSTWSAGGALITGRSLLAGLGTQNSALAVGGFSAPTTFALSEEYNGSTWSAGGNLINARYYLAGAGYQDAAVVFGGFNVSPISSLTEEYDGSAWSSANSMINAKCSHAGAGFQSSALAFGGQNPSACASLTEEYSYAASTETTFEHTDTGRLVFSQISSSLDFASDSAAAAGGVPLGGIYRNGGDIKIRLV